MQHTLFRGIDVHRSRYLFALPLAALVTLSGPSAAQQKGPEERLDAAAREYFTDVQLVTQSGERVRLYSDLLKDKVVVINAFFGTCTGSCPMISGVLAGLQERIGDRLGKDVFFLSFSVDPETDTPAKLKEYAERFHARPGWLFLTGEKRNVDFALAKLGQKVEKKEDHLTIFMVGNNRTGLWKKVFAPTSTADSLKAIVDSVLNDKG
jgi:protein SCO1/2